MWAALLPLLVATVGAKVVRIPTVQEQGRVVTFEEGLPEGWKVRNMRLVNTTDQRDTAARLLGLPDSGHGTVAVPQVSMTGSQWGVLSRKIRLPAHMQVSVDFSILVTGASKSQQSDFMSTSPDFEMVWGPSGSLAWEGEKVWLLGATVTTLEELQPGEGWQHYQAEVVTGNTTSDYLLELRASLGSSGAGLVALDDVEVRAVPLVGSQYIREQQESPAPKATTITGDSADSTKTPDDSADAAKTTASSVIVTSVANVTDTAANNTEIQPTPAYTYKPDNSSKVDETDKQPATTAQPDEEKKTAIPAIVTLNATTPACANGTSSSSCASGQLSPLQDSGNSSVYGYTGEVVLVSLAVVFAVLFLLMVVKYQRLKTHMGDYQLERSPGPAAGRPPEYDNPAYQVQMSYRANE